MDDTKTNPQEPDFDMNPLFKKDAFLRLDETDDSLFYSKDRFVSHLDSFAKTTVNKIIDELIIEENPAILDLMAGWESHLPERLTPARVVGLGLNENEIRNNKDLTETVVHDINKNPTLPFPSNTFDIVINTVSVDYMVKPIDIFQEVARILKPGGLFLVIFSNRMFPQKAVKVWRESGEEERVLIVDDFFKLSKGFELPRFFVSKKKARPENDKYEALGIPSDPIYAVYAEKKGGAMNRKKRPDIALAYGVRLDKRTLEIREQRVKDTLECPHCGKRLKKWEVPDNPFCQTWDNDYMYICFNDECVYFVRGWDQMYNETSQNMSYRLMYNPEKDRCSPIPVPTPHALKEGIVD